jgi:hypothetical protein
MTTLEVVCRQRGALDLAEDRDNAPRYAEVKARILPYCQVLLSQGTSPAALSVRQAPLGAVRSRADGERLIQAMSKEFPGFRFIMVTLACQQRDEAIFVPHEGATEFAQGPHQRFSASRFRIDDSPARAG